MFGFGNRNRQQVRNDTFGPSRVRNAMLAGAGMLAWRWWRNRQANNQSTLNHDRTFADTQQTRSAGSM
jgi:predicted negative regulator of RcsB-dependent stress response